MRKATLYIRYHDRGVWSYFGSCLARNEQDVMKAYRRKGYYPVDTTRADIRIDWK